MNPYANENPLTVETPVHRVFGAKENSEYIDRKGAYIIPLKDDKVGVIETAKGFFLIGGGSVPSRRFLEMQSWAIMQVWEREHAE